MFLVLLRLVTSFHFSFSCSYFSFSIFVILICSPPVPSNFSSLVFLRLVPSPLPFVVLSHPLLLLFLPPSIPPFLSALNGSPHLSSHSFSLLYFFNSTSCILFPFAYNNSPPPAPPPTSSCPPTLIQPLFFLLSWGGRVRARQK